MAVEVTVIKSITVDPSFLQQIASSMPEWFQQGDVVVIINLFFSDHYQLRTCFFMADLSHEKGTLFN